MKAALCMFFVFLTGCPIAPASSPDPQIQELQMRVDALEVKFEMVDDKITRIRDMLTEIRDILAEERRVKPPADTDTNQ